MNPKKIKINILKMNVLTKKTHVFCVWFAIFDMFVTWNTKKMKHLWPKWETVLP